MKRKLCAIAACLLLVGCNSPEFNRPIINTCTVFEDVSRCRCVNSKGEEYINDCWGYEAVSPTFQKRGEQYVRDLEKCALACTAKDCSQLERYQACPDIFLPR